MYALCEDLLLWEETTPLTAIFRWIDHDQVTRYDQRERAEVPSYLSSCLPLV